jgi:hypothetical protein
LHAVDDIWKKRDHVVVAHRHIGDDALQRNLLDCMVFVPLSSSIQFSSKLRDFALSR